MIAHRVGHNFSLLLILLLTLEPTYAATNPQLLIQIWSGMSESFYSVEIRHQQDLFVKRLKKTNAKEHIQKSYEEKFEDIANLYNANELHAIKLKMAETYKICGVGPISAIKKDVELDFGGVSPAYRQRSISRSPNNLYAIVKSNYGPYFLLNLNSLNFENICIVNGKNIVWSGDFLLAVAVEDDVFRTKEQSSTLEIYNIKEKKLEKKYFQSKQIQDIVWLDDGETIGMLLSEIIEKFGLFSSILTFAGHPPQYKDYALDIYNYKTAKNLSVKIENGVKNSKGFIYLYQ